jgi:hypothetical protein
MASQQIKRSYYLPQKLVEAFDKECGKFGYVREKVVATAILHFLNSDPNTRAKMFERLNGFLSSRRR